MRNFSYSDSIFVFGEEELREEERVGAGDLDRRQRTSKLLKVMPRTCLGIALVLATG